MLAQLILQQKTQLMPKYDKKINQFCSQNVFYEEFMC